MSYTSITYEIVNKVARITTQRPEYRNAQFLCKHYLTINILSILLIII